MKMKTRVYMITAITAAIALFGAGDHLYKVKAAEQPIETVDIRIINTTDLHGQLNSKDYEQGVDYNNRGLARIYDLIQTARGELPKENSITLDAGDVLYDYTTEYIFSENQIILQPIYKAMAKIGYDAITLGNHDFDYGYEYILKQLNVSGLRDVTVVSNVTDSKTGEYPFLEHMLLTKKMITDSGKEVEVTIGIIGQTIPSLTSKTHSYTGILKTEDMVLNAKDEAAKLKEMGADIIIALSHTGIGPENPEFNFKNVAYALTKIPEIDVVVCGHEHNLFPTTDLTSPYFKLPGVDKKTFLMNGKNVIMAGDRGRALGVVDLTLEVSGDSIMIVDRNSEVRMVTAENTMEDKEIAGFFGDREERLLEYSTKIIGELDKDLIVQNYYGLLGDNYAIQLLNDSKIDYAMRYVNTLGKSYKNYPIIAASAYAAYGAESAEDFVNIRDNITESDLTTLQPYNNYLYLYSITGKQLKEWLEWSASAYESSAGEKVWTDKAMSSLMKESGLKSLISEEWLNNWSSFYIFDGIDYVVNPYIEPRYDISGNRINSTNRIQSIKYNGEDVKDDTILILATSKITQPTAAIKGVEQQVVLNGFTRGQAILGKYVEQSAKSGSILPQVDNNWRVNFPRDYTFLVKAPDYAQELVLNTSWYVDYLTQQDDYRYYKASFPVISQDTTGPHIIVTPIITSATASPYEAVVHVSDASAIKSIQYLDGDYDLDHAGWVVSNNIDNNGTFTVAKNGIYSILAEDTYGNKTIKKLVVTNFDQNILSKPTVVTYTNRKSAISGTAEPNTKIIFEAYYGTYESMVTSTGKYSYALPSQPSGSTVIVYVKDETKGLESERVYVPVKRTGPNQPRISYPLDNNSDNIIGAVNDEDAMLIAVVGNTVYVPRGGGIDFFIKNTEIYNKNLKIVETDVEMYDSGYFNFHLPPQIAGKTVSFYNIDHLSRNSRPYTTTVAGIAPNAPFVYEITNIEKSLTGYVPTSYSKNYDITITIGDTIYRTVTDKSGNFSLQFEDQLHTGQIITVGASDSVKGNIRVSYATQVTVNDINSYLKPNSTNLMINRVTTKSYLISGTYADKGIVYMAIVSGQGETFQSNLYLLDTDDSARFKYRLEEKLEVGTKIYVMTRFSDGKILLANSTVVLPGRPDTPSLVKDITNADKLVLINADKDCEVTVTIGTKSYVSSTYQIEELTGLAVYSFVVDRNGSGIEIKITATNVTGTSDAFTSKIVKAAPDQPMVEEVIEGDKVITGNIELLDYILPEQDINPSQDVTPALYANSAQDNTLAQDPVQDSIPAQDTIPAQDVKQKQDITPTQDIILNEKAQDLFKDAPALVAQTQTRIFAQIGKKTYEGTIDQEGNFTITIPAQTAGTAIKIWGTNKAGRGPLIKVVVVAK